ncbi:MAG: thioredoxin [Bacteroidota bacterium]
MKGKFKKIINDGRPVLVDFHATWCGPCHTQAPILKQVSAELGEKTRIVKIDVDKNQILAQQYQVRSIPTLILFKNGKPVWRHSGVAQKRQLVSLIKQHA